MIIASETLEQLSIAIVTLSLIVAFLAGCNRADKVREDEKQNGKVQAVWGEK